MFHNRDLVHHLAQIALLQPEAILELEALATHREVIVVEAQVVEVMVVEDQAVEEEDNSKIYK
jgi:hypothetical protein